MSAKVGERLPYLLAKLKAPRVRERLQATAERAREEGWPLEGMSETRAADRDRSVETCSSVLSPDSVTRLHALCVIARGTGQPSSVCDASASRSRASWR
jgi:hypothetical protein